MQDKTLYYEVAMTLMWSFAAGIFAYVAWNALGEFKTINFAFGAFVVAVDMTMAWRHAKAAEAILKERHGENP